MSQSTSKRPKKMTKAEVIAENEKLRRMIEASRQLWEGTLAKLQEENATLRGLLDEIYHFFVLENKRKNKEKKDWFIKRAGKYINGITN